jgi:hypothetical protein
MPAPIYAPTQLQTIDPDHWRQGSEITQADAEALTNQHNTMIAAAASRWARAEVSAGDSIRLELPPQPGVRQLDVYANGDGRVQVDDEGSGTPMSEEYSTLGAWSTMQASRALDGWLTLYIDGSSPGGLKWYGAPTPHQSLPASAEGDGYVSVLRIPDDLYPWSVEMQSRMAQGLSRAHGRGLIFSTHVISSGWALRGSDPYAIASIPVLLRRHRRLGLSVQATSSGAGKIGLTIGTETVSCGSLPSSLGAVTRAYTTQRYSSGLAMLYLTVTPPVDLYTWSIYEYPEG